jgi:hypothetical protein
MVNHGKKDQRCDLGAAMSEILIPEFEMTTILLVPFFVEIDDEIDSSFLLGNRVDRVVKVHIELTTTRMEVKTSTMKERILLQIVNTSELLDEINNVLAL